VAKFLSLFHSQDEMMPKSSRQFLVTLVLTVRLTASFYIRQFSGHRHVTAQPAYDLNSAFEWLSDERYQHPGYENIEWLDLSSPTEGSNERNDDGLLTMPLYPLGATYLPSTVNQTLNNVEPQNLQMAKDLLSDEASASGLPPQFCVALRALDTGRLANIGTVLRILEADEQFRDDGTLVRIRLTCRAEKVVKICSVINPEAFAPENRMRKSSEYLRCQVQMTSLDEGDDDIFGENNGDLEQDIKVMVDSFNMIKTIYQLEIGKAAFPPSTLFQLGNAMSTWDATKNFSSKRAFWDSAQEWQSVCHTIRQATQAMLSINRDELMVEAASAAGGPLKLPIHLEDLSPQVRREIQLMEVAAQKEYFELGMDPCLDFQAFLSLPNNRERILLLARMISRERGRLEVVATESSQKKRAGRF
jgi:Lon protease-like protein